LITGSVPLARSIELNLRPGFSGFLWRLCWNSLAGNGFLRFETGPRDALPDPNLSVGGADGSNWVNRGGSWNNDVPNCRTANRNTNEPTNRTNNNGFRLALNSAGKEATALRVQTEQIVFQSDQVSA
jgi:hypothetical protein